jgi:hypothetical protein
LMPRSTASVNQTRGLVVPTGRGPWDKVYG